VVETTPRLSTIEQTSAAAVDVATLKEEINVVKKQTTGQLPPLESVLPSGTEKKENAA